jgi:hypothetical protein
MRTPLEITIQLDELLKKSKPFRNSNEVFSLTAELFSTLSPSEAVIEEQIIETIINNPIEFTEPTEEDIKSFNESVASFLEIESVEEPITEQPVVAKRGAKKK